MNDLINFFTNLEGEIEELMVKSDSLMTSIEETIVTIEETAVAANLYMQVTGGIFIAMLLLICFQTVSQLRLKKEMKKLRQVVLSLKNDNGNVK